MAMCRVVTLCLLVVAVGDLCSGLMLERLRRHIPRSRLLQGGGEDSDDINEELDTSVEKQRIVQDPSQLAPFIMKPTWKAIIPFAQDKTVVRSHKKRNAPSGDAGGSAEQHELATILQDDDGLKTAEKKKKKNDKRAVQHHTKTKRESNPEPAPDAVKDVEKETEPKEQEESFQDWLQKEYYRNLAKSFASMRRKRESPGTFGKVKTLKRSKKSVPNTLNSLSDITDNLRGIEDQLFQDALQVMRDGGEEFDEDPRSQNRVTNDLSLAYDLETMRNAFFRLRDTLSNIESESAMDDEEMYHTKRKRSGECPALDRLTTDCLTLNDIMPEGRLKSLLLRACNWHEVCYTCGKVYGLTSEMCDGSFIEQTQTICRDDAPCESTASFLIVPLRQRRLFYKRSNPNVCLEDPCVENFLREGLAALEEGSLAMRSSLNSIRRA